MFTNRWSYPWVRSSLCSSVFRSYSEGQDFFQCAGWGDKVSGNVYMLTGAGGNIGVSAGKDGGTYDRCFLAPLNRKNQGCNVGTFNSKPIRFVVTTHCHQDHTGGNGKPCREGAIIVAHEKCRKRLGSEQFSEFFLIEKCSHAWSALPVILQPGHLLPSDEDEHLNFSCCTSPHRRGCIVHFKRSGVIHTGDLYSTAYTLLSIFQRAVRGWCNCGY